MTGGIGIQNNPQEVAGVSSRRMDAGRPEETTRAAAAHVLEGHVAAVKRVQFDLHQEWRGQEAVELQERHEQDAGRVAELREHSLVQLPMTESIGTEGIPLEAGGVRSQDLAAEWAAALTNGAAAGAFEGQVAAAKREQLSLREEQQHQKELALQEEKQEPVAGRFWRAYLKRTAASIILGASQEERQTRNKSTLRNCCRRHWERVTSCGRERHPSMRDLRQEWCSK